MSKVVLVTELQQYEVGVQRGEGVVILKQPTILLVLSLLAGCVTQKDVGGYIISGRVSDKQSSQPVSDVVIEVTFSSLTLSGPMVIEAAIGMTDADGVFTIDVPRMVNRGGNGGFSGYTAEWPRLQLRKTGYCTIGLGFHSATATEKDLQDMEVKLEKHGQACGPGTAPGF